MTDMDGPKLHRVESVTRANIEFLSTAVSDNTSSTETLGRIFRTVWKKNLWLVVVYTLINFLAAPIMSYYLQSWPSVVVTVCLNLLTTIIGFFAIERTVEIVTTALTNKPAGGWFSNWF